MNPRKHRSCLFSTFIPLAMFCAISAPAATNTVTTLANTGEGSLPEVIAMAAVGDTLVFEVSGTITLATEVNIDKHLNIVGPGAAVLTISGDGLTRLFRIAPNASVLLSRLSLRHGQAPPGEHGGAIYNVGNLTVRGCVIAGNFAGSSFTLVDQPGGSGGGIYNAGQLVVEDSVLAANGAGGGARGGDQRLMGNPGWHGGHGGGIYSEGTLFITRSSVSNNIAGNGGAGGSGQVSGGYGGSGGAGGGIYALTGIVERCSIVSNYAGYGGTGGDSHNGPGGGGMGGEGGGIYGASVLMMTNCTVVGNAAGGGGDGGLLTGFPMGQAGGGPGGNGGGIHAYNLQQAIVSCTVFGNRTGYGGWGGTEGAPFPGARGRGGGVTSFNLAAGALLNNIIAGNDGDAPDIYQFRSAGNNLIGITNASEYILPPGYYDLTGSSDFPLNPQLAALTDNGGPTPTMALMSNSPAINAGTATASPAFDQRGVMRPQGLQVDIGAYEYEFAVPEIVRARFQSASQFRLQACGLPNRTYALQCSSNLVHWSDMIGIATSSNGIGEVVDLHPVDQARFYRLRMLEP